MSSATSTEKAGVTADPASSGTRAHSDRGASDLEPWQFFVLAALGCATAVTFVARGQGPTAIILLSRADGDRRPRRLSPRCAPCGRCVARRTNARRWSASAPALALEREKLLTLRSIKELEFDRAMGRLSDDDWKEMSGRLRARAAGLIRQLDAGDGYRDQIERDLAKRLGSAVRRRPRARSRRPRLHELPDRERPRREVL